jgi:hypothetical protein
MQLGCGLRVKRGSRWLEERGYCWAAGDALDRRWVPGGEGRIMRNAAMATRMMTRITMNTRDLERLGRFSELVSTTAIPVGCWIGAEHEGNEDKRKGQALERAWPSC